MSNTTYYCHAKKHRRSFCRRCARAKHLDQTDELIILGIDPEHTGFWLVQCPDCGKVRSISAITKYRTVKSGDSRCRSCAAINARDPRRFNTESLLVLEPTGASRKRWLVQCPECNEIRELGYGELSRLRKNGHSLCRSCAHIGERHHRWMDDPELKRMYNRAEWYAMRKRVLNRDGHMCQFPGCNRKKSQDGKALSVHHIDPLHNCREHEDDNLITLCSEHHKWADAHLEESAPILLDVLTQP